MDTAQFRGALAFSSVMISRKWRTRLLFMALGALLMSTVVWISSEARRYFIQQQLEQYRAEMEEQYRDQEPTLYLEYA